LFAPTLERKPTALHERIEGLMKEAGEVDRWENELFGESSPMKLPRELRNLKARQERLAALKKVVEIEQKRKAKGRLSEKGPATPTSDPDSSLMKNKTGGFAPNYLVVLAWPNPPVKRNTGGAHSWPRRPFRCEFLFGGNATLNFDGRRGKLCARNPGLRGCLPSTNSGRVEPGVWRGGKFSGEKKVGWRRMK
jgi:hypothetical protein